jgi:hypothetical protein
MGLSSKNGGIVGSESKDAAEPLLYTYEYRFRVIFDPIEWRARAMSQNGPG